MANLITYLYFRDQFELKIVDSPENNIWNRQELDRYITRYEPECLKKFLGYDISDAYCFYNLFIAGKDSEQRFINLKNLIVDSTNKVSPIAGYVYRKWMEFHRGAINSDSQLRTIPNNVIVMNDTDNFVHSWNYMVDLWQDVFDYLIENKATYPEYEITSNPYTKINNFGI